MIILIVYQFIKWFFLNRGRNRRRRRGGRKYRKVKLRFKANAAGEGQTNTYNTGSHDNTVTMPSATTSAANGGSHGNISYLTPANSSTSNRNTTVSLSSATHNTFQQDNNVFLSQRASTPVTMVTDNTHSASESEGVCCHAVHPMAHSSCLFREISLDVQFYAFVLLCVSYASLLLQVFKWGKKAKFVSC